MLSRFFRKDKYLKVAAVRYLSSIDEIKNLLLQMQLDNKNEFKSIEKNLKNEFKIIEKNFQNEFKIIEKKFEKEFMKVNNKLDGFKKGLGKSFEAYNRALLLKRWMWIPCKRIEFENVS